MARNPTESKNFRARFVEVEKDGLGELQKVWKEEVWVKFQGKIHVVGVSATTPKSNLFVAHIFRALVATKVMTEEERKDSWTCFWAGNALKIDDYLPLTSEKNPLEVRKQTWSEALWGLL